MVEHVEERLLATYRYCEVVRETEDYMPEPDNPDLAFDAALNLLCVKIMHFL
ncbi:hypothetical protein F6Y05_39065 [Bacillus megaterium]|nr:hypothetical protein [Priestia megaterium]